ncbi:MAG: LamG domain-containing protein [Akkermansiaceae bacterium]|nr:LamG domain-containing protein [Akkermansiaceae bacterium]
MAMAGVASAATLTEIATMEELATASSDTGTSVTLEAGYDKTTYSFTGAGSILQISLPEVSNYITGGTGYLTIAAWINPTATDENSIFSIGGQNTGFKFALKEGGLQMTTKGIADTNVTAANLGFTSIPTGDWTLVALSVNLTQNGDSRFYMSATDGKCATRNLGAWNEVTGDDLKLAIGSGNAGSVRDGFKGMISNLTLFSSDSLATNSEIAALMGTAPTLTIPEPTTATLSLLALAGLAARRRRR